MLVMRERATFACVIVASEDGEMTVRDDSTGDN